MKMKYYRKKPNSKREILEKEHKLIKKVKKKI